MEWNNVRDDPWSVAQRQSTHGVLIVKIIRDTYLGVSDDIMKAHTLVLKMSWPET